MKIREMLKFDLKAAMDKDPAAKSKWLVKHTYAGYKAIKGYRYAHWLYERGHILAASLLSSRTKKRTGVEIHPAAQIGKGMFIDHGTGIVIGETTEIGEGCVLYQGVTLGGTGKDTGKRHPTLGNNVMVSAGAKVLGPVVIGDSVKIGAGSVVLKNVPPFCTVVGVPGRVVKQEGQRVADMDQILLPDPIMEEFKRLNARIYELEKKAGIHACRYSLTVDQANESTAEAQNEVSCDSTADKTEQK